MIFLLWKGSQLQLPFLFRKLFQEKLAACKIRISTYKKPVLVRLFLNIKKNKL